MSRARKIFAFFIALIIILAAALAGTIFFLPDTDIIRARAESELSKITGQDVTIGKLKVSPSLSGVLRMTAKDVSVMGQNKERLFSAEEVSFSPAIAPLFRRELAVDSIEVKGFRISIWRSKDGALRLPEIPRGALPRSVTKPLKEAPDRNLGDSAAMAPKPETDRKSAKDKQPAKEPQKLSWTINEITLSKGRLDWVDLNVWPGKQTLISLEGVNGRVIGNQQRQYDLDLTGVIRSMGRDCGDVRIQGRATLDESLTDISTLNMEFTTPGIKLEPFKGYIPPKASILKDFEEGKVKSRITWNRPEPAKIEFEAELKGSGEKPAQLDLNGEALLNTTHWSLEKVRVNVQTDYMPLKLIRRQIPPSAPIDPLLGVIKGGFKCDYLSPRQWGAKGAISLENASFKPPLRSVARQARIWAQLDISPQTIVIESLEVSSGRPLAQLKGAITSPFARAPRFDITGKIMPESHWLKAMSIQTPPNLSIKGPFPVSGRVRGAHREMWLDLRADLSRAGIKWKPLLVKDDKSKGSLSLKGKFIPKESSKSGHPYLNALARLGLSNTGIRLSEKGEWLADSNVQAGCKVILSKGSLDLREAKIKARQTGEPGDLISASLEAKNALSPKPDIRGQIQVTLDDRIPLSSGVTFSESVKISGAGALNGTFAKEKSSWNWTAKLPLKHLDISLGDILRKPVGIGGELKAKGRWGNGGLFVDRGLLELPGAKFRYSGLILDGNSKFSGVDVHVQRGDLKNIRAFSPSLGSIPLSGPIEAALSFNADEDGHIEPSGVINLLSVKYSPGPGTWRLADTRGKIVLKGYSVDFPKLLGKVEGAVEGPAKISGALDDINSLKTMNGKVSVYVGPGSLAVKSLVNIVAKAKRFMDALTGNASKGKSDALSFESFGGDFDIKYGKARTENVRLRGGDIKAGAIGAIDLESQKVEAVTGFYTEVKGVNSIGEIPAVKEQLEKYSGILKSTGLAKELKRFGINVPDGNEAPKNEPPPKATPVTVFLRVYGPLSSPDTTPVLEQALPRKITGKLKSIMK